MGVLSINSNRLTSVAPPGGVYLSVLSIFSNRLTSLAPPGGDSPPSSYGRPPSSPEASGRVLSVAPHAVASPK